MECSVLPPKVLKGIQHGMMDLKKVQLVVDMEQELQRNYSSLPSFDRENPSCIGGIFHFFDFHQRFHIKKMPSDKKHGSQRHAEGIKTPSTKLNVCTSEEVDGFIDEADSNPTEHKMKDTGPSKQSGRARIKTLIAEEMAKERKKKRRGPSHPARLVRTASIHYLDYDPAEGFSVGDSSRIELLSQEPSPTCHTHDPLFPNSPENPVISNKQVKVCGTTNGGNHADHSQLNQLGSQMIEKQMPIEKLDGAKEGLLKHKLMDAKDLARDKALLQSKEFLDALEIFNSNRELLRKILQDPNSILVNHFQASPSAKVVLTKCGTFPGPELPNRKNLELLKYDLRQIGSFPKQGVKLQAQNSLLKSKNIDSLDGKYSGVLPLATDEEVGTTLESFSASSQELKNQKDNSLVLNRFKNIKQKLKHVIKESKRERLRIAMDGILHRIPYGRKTSKDAKFLADIQSSSHGCDGAASFSGKIAPYRMRRSSSLNDSLDKYSQLFISISRKEGKVGPTERLKLGHDDAALLPQRHHQKAFSRILSLPDICTYDTTKDVDDEVHQDAPARISADRNPKAESCNPADEHKPAESAVNVEDGEQLDYSKESVGQEELIEVNVSGTIDEDQERMALDKDGYENAGESRIGDDLDELTTEESGHLPLLEQEIEATKNASAQAVKPSPNSVLGSCFEDDIMPPVKISISEGLTPQIAAGLELEPSCIHFDKVDPSINLQNKVSVPKLLGAISDIDSVHSPSKCAQSNITQFQVDTEVEADFNYVKDVLKKSGFSGDELLGTWHSPDQPVDPSLFDEVECSTAENSHAVYESGSGCDHILLFDLINEVLLEIYERSFTYCPWHLCSNSGIRPVPVGDRVLGEVWASISWHLHSQPQLDPTLEYIVTRDLARNNGWMDIQGDAECVGLELEDWILDDLLDEVTYEIAGV